MEAGFRWEGNEYRSLSALASAITGSKSINGYFWFRLTDPTAAKSKTTAKSAPVQQEVARAQ